MTRDEALVRPLLRTQAALAACGIFSFINVYATQPLLPMLGRLYAVSKVELGMTVSAVTCGLALSAPLFGLFTENADRRRVITSSLFLLTLVTLAVALAPTIPVLIAFRVLQGLILPGVFTGAIAYVNEEYQGGRASHLMRIYISGTILGGFLGRLITGETARYFGWRSGFYVLGALTLLGGIFIAKSLPPGKPKQRVATPSILANLLTLHSHALNLRLLPLCFVGFSLLFCLVATFTYVTYYLAAAPFLLNTQQLSWLFSVYLFGMLATPMSALLLNRLSTRWIIVAAMLFSLAGVLITLAHTLLMVILGLIVCSTGVFIGQAAALSQLRHVTDESKPASVSGFYLAFYYLGGTVGGVIPGYFWRHGGWTATVALIVFVQILTVIVALVGLSSINEAKAWNPADLMLDGPA